MRLLLFVLGWTLLSLPLAMLIGRYLRGRPEPRYGESRATETVGEGMVGRESLPRRAFEPNVSGHETPSPARDHEHTPELIKRLRSAGWHELDPGRTA